MKQYIVDAFTDRVFGGNPAAVCVLDGYPEDELMMSITLENNLSETAFAVPEKDDYHLRWFTPGGEIDFCGHATLATGFTILNVYHPEWDRVKFYTMSGEMLVERKEDRYEMDLPAYDLQPREVTDQMEKVLGFRPLEAWMARDLVCVLENEEQVRNCTPDFAAMMELDGLMCHVTAMGSGEYDCVSRSFGPKLKINEDPVCGSGHSHILPYWFKKLGKEAVAAWQASRRGGALYGVDHGSRIRLSGKAVFFAESNLHI